MKQTTRFQRQNAYRHYIARIKARFGPGVDVCDERTGWRVYREVRVAPGMYGMEMKTLWSGTDLADALNAPVPAQCLTKAL